MFKDKIKKPNFSNTKLDSNSIIYSNTGELCMILKYIKTVHKTQFIRK